MSEIVNKLLLAEDKNIFEIHLRQSGSTYHLLKTKKNCKDLKKQEIPHIFIKTK